MITYSNKYNGEEVSLCPRLEKDEIETCINFSQSSDGFATIHSNEPKICERLLHADFFVLREVELYGKKRKKVVGVSGLIPIGSINIGKPRSSNSVSRVIKAPRKEYTEEEKKANREEMKKKLNGKAVRTRK